MIDYASVFTNVNGSFPTITGKNATGAGATDGTEFIAAFVDDGWGRYQALMSRAGLTPDGVTESTTNSQHIESLKKGFNLGAGYIVSYNKAGTPAANGDRLLLLTGQGITRANYPELDDACYVGDANNAAVAAAGGAFFRADNSDGSSPNITGIYLILPDLRGRVLRGLDVGALVDPDGASRVLGDEQEDAFQLHQHSYGDPRIGYVASGTLNAMGVNPDTDLDTDDYVSDGGGTPRVTSETRMANVSTNWAITY